jgi:hypothetical protein
VQQREAVELMSAYAWVTVAFVVPLVVLGLVALIRARPEDIPAVMRTLARWGRR